MVFSITSTLPCLPTGTGVIIASSSPASKYCCNFSLHLDAGPASATASASSVVNTSAGFAPPFIWSTTSPKPRFLISL